MVEFALILPVLVLLLVMTIDLGRVFFGWVALQNAARIGADHAARFPDAWPPPGGNPLETKALQLYLDLVTQDLQAINCDPDVDGDGDVDHNDLPVTFADVNGNGLTKDDGDHAIVRLTCTFDLLTPFANFVMGGPVHMSAEAVFPINESATLGLPTPLPSPLPTPGPTPPPTPSPSPCAAPVAEFVGVPVSGTASILVKFTDKSSAGGSCPITAWLWEFGDGTTSTAQSPPNHLYAYTPPGAKDQFSVKLTVTSSSGSDFERKQNYITVNKP